MTPQAAEILKDLAASAIRLSTSIDALVADWLAPLLTTQYQPPKADKHINDPIWGTIAVHPWEVALLDTQLVQRLRGVKQLGLAHLVFPTATHDRFSHACGVLEASSRMIESLNRNALARLSTSSFAPVSPASHNLIRLSALLHDIGHGPFSHAIEPVIKKNYGKEIRALETKVQLHFPNVTDISVSEAVAILMVISPTFQEVLSRPWFSKLIDGASVAEVVCRIIGAIGGASDGSSSGCLAAIISSQIDADKLDYMARDAHHSGLPINFDTHRLISKLEFVWVEESAISNRLETLKERIRKHTPPRYQNLGIAYGGTGAFEQMLVGRIFLYDRLYHHHKVRTADAIAQRLVHYASPTGAFEFEALFAPISDEAIIHAFGGSIQKVRDVSGKEISFHSTPEASHLSAAILSRNLYKRAFAFAGRFIAGLDRISQIDDDPENTDPLSEEEKDAERSRVMTRVNQDLAEFEARISTENEISALAAKLGDCFDDSSALKLQGRTLKPHHIIVDLPRSPYPARITTLVRMDDGRLDVPDLFYDPARWAEVYSIQRRTGYVFADSAHREIIALASQIWFLRKYNCVLDEAASHFSKTQGLIPRAWYDAILQAGAITDREHDYLVRPRLVLVPFSLEARALPKQWVETRPEFVGNFNAQFNAIIVDGISALAERELRAALRGVFRYVQTRSEDATFVTGTVSTEAQLQQDLVRSLRDQKLDVIEGSKRAGGETDLIAGHRVLIENKLIKKPTDTPFAEAVRAGAQGRRYAMPTGERFVLTVVAYQAATETGRLAPSRCVEVRKMQETDVPFVEIRVCVRFGDSVPSRA